MDEQQRQRIQEFLDREYSFRFSAGECNLLIQLLAYLVEANPAFLPGPEGRKDQREPLNYQSIRSIILLNEKLNGQLQKFAADASVLMDEMKPVSEKVQ